MYRGCGGEATRKRERRVVGAGQLCGVGGRGGAGKRERRERDGERERESNQQTGGQREGGLFEKAKKCRNDTWMTAQAYRLI